MASPDTLVSPKKNLIHISENLVPPEDQDISAGAKHKRSPTTPLHHPVKQMNITRRKYEEHESSIPRFLDFSTGELMKSKYEKWLVSLELKEAVENVKFLELERKLEREERDRAAEVELH